MEKTGFFEEQPGRKSSTRLNSFLLLIFFMVFNLYYVISNSCGLNADFIMFDVLMLTAVFAPKYLHKVAELKSFGKKREEKPSSDKSVRINEKS